VLLRRVGVVTKVEKPVVLLRTSEDVLVTEETTPLLVVTTTVTTCLVELATSADVTVVFEVLLVVFVVLGASEVGDEPAAAVDEGAALTTEVVWDVWVVRLVRVVGVLFDVVVMVRVDVD